MNNAATTSGILAGILLGLARDGAVALNRIPFSNAGKPEESARDLAKLVRDLVAEGVLDGDAVSRQIPKLDYVGEFGPELCSVCHAICDFGSRGDGGASQNPHTGVIHCGGSPECDPEPE